MFKEGKLGEINEEGILVWQLPAFLPNSPSNSACVPVRGRSTISIVTTSDRASSLVHITRPGTQDSLLFCNHSFHFPHPVTVCSLGWHFQELWLDNISPFMLVERTRLYVHYENWEPVCAPHSGQILAVFMRIRRWKIPKKLTSFFALWKDVLDLYSKSNDY